MKPMIKYRGGKSKEIKEFISYVPNSYRTYVEPFAGGAALFFYLAPQKAMLNDINKKLIQFYLGVKDNFSVLHKELSELETLYQKNQEEYEFLKKNRFDEFVENKNEKLYYEIRNMYNQRIQKEYLDATLYYFINKTAYSGMLRFNSNGEYNVPFGRYKNFNAQLVSKEHSELLQRARILNEDYSDIFTQCDSDDFIFLDPPYDCIFTDYGNIDKEDFSEDSHKKLAQDFRNLSSKTLMVIGKTKLTEELYKPFIRSEYKKNYAVNIRNRFKSENMHLIITNYTTE